MTKRIFHAIWIVTLSVFLAAVLLFFFVLYDYFSEVQQKQLKTETALAAQGVTLKGEQYFHGLDLQNYRITWIAKDGAVLYDTKSDTHGMENHLEREEIKEALSTGVGESSRYSTTLTERYFYCAQLLPDGSILRLSISGNSIFTLLWGMMQPICFIFVLAFILSLFLASRVSKKIVQPLNKLNLDAPLENDGYDELAPLLRRIDHQQKQIRKQSASLHQKQQEFETVTQDMSEGIILLNGKLNILSINPAAKELFGVHHPCIGSSMLSICRGQAMQALLQQAELGKHAETIIDLHDGKYQLHASPILSEETVSGVVLLLLDVTEKEKLEQMRREFTANVSHELKTPLHTISGCAELLSNGFVKNTDIPQFSKQIYTEAQRMIQLIEDIIQLSHLDEGASNMIWEVVDLYATVQQTVETLLPQAQHAQVEFHITGTCAYVHAIPHLLVELIYNLCDNAIKYNRADGSIFITVDVQEESALLTIADTGIGIPAECQERIFERFYRVDKSHSKEIGGTGLGLSIVKHAAKLHHAAITVESELAKGTTITVTFPLWTEVHTAHSL